MAGISKGMAELSRRAFAGLMHLPGHAMSSAGGLAGRVVGGFLAGVSAARYQSSGPGAYHDAARRDQTNRDWRATLTSANQAILDELDTMLARSRQAIANDGWAASAQAGYGRYVVGGGITAISAARHPTDRTVGLLRNFNEQLDLLWRERQYTPRLIDAEQTKTGPEKQRVWMNELFAAGGVFVIPQYLPDPRSTRLVLQEIEYEQRDTVIYSHDGRAVRGGIEVGDWNEPVAYHLHTAGHPLDDYATKSTRITADRCHHIYRQDRVRQRIGTPWLKPVLPRLRQLAMYEAYTMVQARGRAANVGFIKQTQAQTAGLPAAVAKQLGVSNQAIVGGEASDDGTIRVNAAPGLWTVLKPGQEPYLPNPATPDNMYPPFVLEQLKGISAGTGLDFTTVCRWYADGNFSSQRQAKLDIWAEVDWIQDLLFISKILRADREQFIDLAVREGVLRASGYFEDPTGAWRRAYQSTNWQGPPRNSIDEIKDEAAWDMKIKSGRASVQDYCNVHGKRMDQVLSEMAEFRRVAAEQGVADVVDTWLLGRSSTPNKPKAGMRPDGTDGGDPPGDGAESDDGGNGNRTDLAQLAARQHVLMGLLDDGGGNGNGRIHK